MTIQYITFSVTVFYILFVYNRYSKLILSNKYLILLIRITGSFLYSIMPSRVRCYWSRYWCL